MAILFAAGETITAGKLNRLQPTTYGSVGSGTVAAGSTAAIISGSTITLTTLGANAIFVAQAIWDVDLTGAGTLAAVCRVYVDGASQAPFAPFQAEVSTDRSSIGQNYRGVLAAAGSHSFDLRATTQANQTIVGINSTLIVTIYEQN